MLIETRGQLRERGAVTERSAYEHEIARLNRLYAALSHVNQAIVWAKTSEALFERVCHVLVEHGGFRMAWIGWHDPETHSLVPVASAGDAREYLDRIRAYTDERPEGHGPSGTAFREGRAYVCNDLAADPATLPWRAELARFGFNASAAFPIKRSGVPCGTLNVYSERRGFFEDKETALLVEAANDVSFALDNIANEAERLRASALADKEARFANVLVESVPGILYLYDETGRFLRWNRNFEAVSGFTTAEIATMHPLDFFTGEEKDLLAARIAETFAKGESSVEASFVSKDMRTTPYYFTGKRIVFDGAPCLVGVGVDISERIRAETALRQTEERYRTTLDGILEGGQLIGFDWRYLYLNHAAELHNRRPNTELLGRTMSECWPGIEATSVYALMQRCMETRVANHEEVEFVFPDGRRGWFDVRAQPVPEGIFVLSIDISERKTAEHALRELNESLERKVAERTRDLEAARVRAESADRIKSAFLATMSHELRTPLNSIIGFTGIILQGLAGALNPEQSKQLGMVQSSARHLLDLINDVLDISKIEAGQLTVHFAAMDLRASIERVAQSVGPHLAKKGLSLDVRLPPSLPPLESDRRRVEQILLNLLNNAIKFTDRGGVTVLVEFPGDRDAETSWHAPAVSITVSDTGIGMKKEDIGKLFQPFRQIDSGLERQHEGTGLGLAICHRLAKLLGGTIRADSTWAEGSAFTVTLPLVHRT